MNYEQCEEKRNVYECIHKHVSEIDEHIELECCKLGKNVKMTLLALWIITLFKNKNPYAVLITWIDKIVTCNVDLFWCPYSLIIKRVCFGHWFNVHLKISALLIMLHELNISNKLDV